MNDVACNDIRRISAIYFYKRVLVAIDDDLSIIYYNGWIDLVGNDLINVILGVSLCNATDWSETSIL